MRNFKNISLLLLLAAMLSGTAHAAFINPPDSTIVAEKKGVGGRKTGEQAAVIMLVRSGANTANAVTINSEDAVVYDTVSDDGVTVRTTTTSGDGAFAGIAVTAILSSDSTTSANALDDYGRRNWGYILVHGKCTAKVTAGGTNGNTAGALLITSKDAGAITTLEAFGTAFTVDSGTINTQIRAGSSKGGFFYNAADGTSTSVPVQIENE